MSVTQFVKVTKGLAQPDVTLLNFSKIEEFLKPQTYSVVGVSAKWVPVPLYERLKELTRDYQNHKLRIGYTEPGRNMDFSMYYRYDIGSLPALLIFDGDIKRATVHTPQISEAKDSSGNVMKFYGSINVPDKEGFPGQLRKIMKDAVGEDVLTPITKLA